LTVESKEPNEKGFLTVITNLDDVIFGRSISMFHDINELIITFYEKNPEDSVRKHKSEWLQNQNTKKVYFRNSKLRKTLKHR
jgi:hypothetical protein